MFVGQVLCQLSHFQAQEYVKFFSNLKKKNVIEYKNYYLLWNDQHSLQELQCIYFLIITRNSSAGQMMQMDRDVATNAEGSFPPNSLSLPTP